MSETNCQKIFGLAQKLNYFQGDLDAHIKHIAQTGQKTLRYSRRKRMVPPLINWSQNPDVKELTQLFSGIADDDRLRAQTGIPVSLRQAWHGAASEGAGGASCRPRRSRNCT